MSRRLILLLLLRSRVRAHDFGMQATLMGLASSVGDRPAQDRVFLQENNFQLRVINISRAFLQLKWNLRIVILRNLQRPRRSRIGRRVGVNADAVNTFTLEVSLFRYQCDLPAAPVACLRTMQIAD